MPVPSSRGAAPLAIVALLAAWSASDGAAQAPAGSDLPPPVELTAQEDHQRMLRLLGIEALRPGPSGDPKAPNAANRDESKANPYPNLPDPLRMRDGTRVTTAEEWAKRRLEIMEDFDREVYGRVPPATPSVSWEVLSTAREVNGDIPVITKRLVGHVDNSSYPHVTVDIQLTVYGVINGQDVLLFDGFVAAGTQTEVFEAGYFKVWTSDLNDTWVTNLDTGQTFYMSDLDGEGSFDLAP